MAQTNHVYIICRVAINANLSFCEPWSRSDSLKNKHVLTPHFCTIRQTKDNLHEGDRPDLCHKQHKRVMAASAFITINVVSQRACDTFFMKLSVIDKSSFFSYKARDESIFGTIRLRWQNLHHTFFYCLMVVSLQP